MNMGRVLYLSLPVLSVECLYLYRVIDLICVVIVIVQPQKIYGYF